MTLYIIVLSPIKNKFASILVKSRKLHILRNPCFLVNRREVYILRNIKVIIVMTYLKYLKVRDKKNSKYQFRL